MEAHWHLGALASLWLIHSQLGIPGWLGPSDSQALLPGTPPPDLDHEGPSPSLLPWALLRPLLLASAFHPPSRPGPLSPAFTGARGWRLSHAAALVPLGTMDPWQTLSQSTVEDAGQGALVLPCPIASAPYSSHILRQGEPGSHRTQEWEPLPRNHRLPLGPFAPSARAGPSISHLLLSLLSGQLPTAAPPLLTILT